MKRIMPLVAAAMLLAACGAEAEAPEPGTPAAQTSETKDQTVSQPKNGAVYELKISGMSCQHCSAAVTKLITGVAGVESATVDHVSGRATVHAKPGAKLDQAKLKAAIDQDYKVESCTLVAP